MKILAVGHDAAPDRAFRKLVSFAARRYSVDSILLDTGRVPPPSMLGLESKVRWADAVIIGMSTPAKNAEIEIAAARECIASGTAFGFYADTHGAWTRPHFTEFASKASFVCVVNEDEARRAKERFVNARVRATGNPLWAPFFQPADRTASRKESGTEVHEFLILVPGTKNLAHNREYFLDSVKAATTLKNAHVIFTRRNGDQSPPDSYDDIVALGNNRGVRVTMRGEQSDPIVPGADIIINGTSVRVHALARRIPAIDYFTKLSQDWLEQDIGSRVGPFFGSGAVIDLYDSDWRMLAHAMNRIRDNPDMLRAAQSRLVLEIDEVTVLASMLAAIDPVHAPA